MYPAKVKYPYKKEWEKDAGYGLSAPITFETEKIGDYRQYVNALDPKKQWVRELKKGEEVYLEENSVGSGYIIKPIPQKNSDEPVQKDESIQKTDDLIKVNAQILGDCIREVESQLEGTTTPFTGEDVRSLAISLFIQLMKNKKTNLEYSFN